MHVDIRYSNLSFNIDLIDMQAKKEEGRRIFMIFGAFA
jgi:hypothetical protein